MLDRLAAEIRCIDFLACLDDRPAHCAGTREQVEQLVAIAPADRPLQRGQVFRKPRQHFEDGVLVVQADVAPHGRVRGGKAREITKARRGVFDDLGFGHRFEIVGRADDVVGDDVRQMRDDRQHHVMVRGIHRVDFRAAAFPEMREFRDSARVRPERWRQDAPAAVEQIGKAGIRSRMLGAGDRVARDEVDAGRHVRCHLRNDRAFGGADIGEDRAGLQRGGNRLGYGA